MSDVIPSHATDSNNAKGRGMGKRHPRQEWGLRRLVRALQDGINIRDTEDRGVSNRHNKASNC